MQQNFETNEKKITLYQTTQHTTILAYFFSIFFLSKFQNLCRYNYKI